MIYAYIYIYLYLCIYIYIHVYICIHMGAIYRGVCYIPPSKGGYDSVGNLRFLGWLMQIYTSRTPNTFYLMGWSTPSKK